MNNIHSSYHLQICLEYPLCASDEKATGHVFEESLGRKSAQRDHCQSVCLSLVHVLLRAWGRGSTQFLRDKVGRQADKAS